MEHKNIDGEEAMMLEIASLVDEQVIWVPLEHNMCKDLKYVVFKVSGFRNTVMSYLNSTNEMANFLNFEKLTEKIAALAIEEEELKEQILYKAVGEKAARYLKSPKTHHQFIIDTQNYVLMVSRNSSCSAYAHMGLHIH